MFQQREAKIVVQENRLVKLVPDCVGAESRHSLARLKKRPPTIWQTEFPRQTRAFT